MPCQAVSYCSKSWAWFNFCATRPYIVLSELSALASPCINRLTSSNWMRGLHVFLTGLLLVWTQPSCILGAYKRCSNGKATWNRAVVSLILEIVYRSPASYLHSSLGRSEQHQLFMVLFKAPIRWQLWPHREQAALLQIALRHQEQNLILVPTSFIFFFCVTLWGIL